jgi:bifunctional non-homologous end joining protein LigD
VSRRPQVEIDGRQLSLSNLDKVLYPKAGFTKAQVIDYYVRISPVLLPHLRDRPMTLKRYPNGVEGMHFYEKRCPPHRPKWVKTAPVWSHGRGAHIDFCLFNDLPTLVWAANLADLELHPYLHRKDALELPTVLAFDLDPGPPANIVQCCRVAQEIRELFEHLGLVCFPKTSGSKGLQVYVPLNSGATYDQTKAFARAVAQWLTQRAPDRVVSRMLKALRPGKVLVDWSQNDEHKTTVGVYSLRARDRPTVSTPITWAEVDRCLKQKDPAVLEFEWDEVLRRVQRHGDLFAPVLGLSQRLPRTGPQALELRETMPR